MNKSIKNIFAIAALMLTPALRCEDTQTHTVSTSKLQSAINYIKNIRTPLTPQETLAQHIAQADVAGFKSGYDTFMQSGVTPEERTATLQALTITAQEVKQALQTELDTMSNKVKKTTLAKGVAQTVGSAILLTTVICRLNMSYKMITLDYDAFKDWVDTSICIKTLKTAPFKYITETYYIVTKTILGEPSDNKYIASGIFYALAGTTLGTYTAKTGIQNCINGLNYRAYLGQQMDNIDQISTYIQEQQKLI